MMNPGKPTFENVPATPETGAEALENGQNFEVPKAPETASEKPVPQTSNLKPQTSATPAPIKDETTRGVETILEEGVEASYKQMTPVQQARFKQEGERVTSELTGMIKSLRVKAGKVLKLITGWLKLIPGVNRFFLIQEAKIKTDKVLALAEAEKKRRASST